MIVPLNTRLKGKEAGFILRRSGARLLVTVGEFLGTRYPRLLADESLPQLERMVMLGRPAPGAGARPSAGLGRSSWPAAAHSARAAVRAAHERVAPEDIADILFTSGTTGEPKGVLSSHQQNVRVFRTWSEVVGLTRGDRYLGVNPFFHSFGYKAGWLACLLQGATLYPLAVFDAGRALDDIERERITRAARAADALPEPARAREPAAPRPLLAAARGHRRGQRAAGAHHAHAARSCKFRSVLTAYGLTESTGVVTVCPHDADDETVATRCGVAIPGVEVRCADCRRPQRAQRRSPGRCWCAATTSCAATSRIRRRRAQAIDCGRLAAHRRCRRAR